jgi:putative transposase
MKNPLQRWYGSGHLHFITCSCYRRLPLLQTGQARDCFLENLAAVRDRYDFALLGFVVMPEHIHMLMSEPNVGNPSEVMKTLKQKVSRALRGNERMVPTSQMAAVRFWQNRFYDFNVWSVKKKNEKLNYIHFNPVKRGLVARPADWRWSSHLFYWRGEEGLCAPNPEWCGKGGSGLQAGSKEKAKSKPAGIADAAKPAAPSC